MSEPYHIDGKLIHNSGEVTADFRQASAPAPTPVAQSVRTRPCGIAWPGSSTANTQNLACVLRHRLLIAALIPAAGFSIFFIRNLLWPQDSLGLQHQWHSIITGSGAASFILIATLLASQIPLSVRQLRIVELILFGTLAGYFGFLQVIMLRQGRIMDWANEAHKNDVVRMANMANNLRWFALIVIYGTFVPNTWRRSASFVGLWFAIPVALNFLVCTNCSIMGPHMFNSLLDTIIVLGIASAIAIFGSYKISELQQEALQARRLGQYQLKKKLGTGGMGEVYLGEHLMLRRACAIKLIRPEHNGDVTSMSRFEREVKSMAQLTHWNTVEIFDYGMAEDGTFYYVMEYLPGMSLQDIVEQHEPLPPARAVHFLRQVCDALQEAHSMNLIHRDIKPNNVLATKRGGTYDVAKLLDFGLVQSVGVQDSDARLTIQGTVLGSPPYMSPEQALGKPSLDARTDIYSVGGLAYFLLTGHPPFERETAMQVLMAHVYDDVIPPSEWRADIPPDVEEIILRCLHKDPAERFQDAESLERAFEQCDCAGHWTRRDAAEWWKAHAAEGQQELAAVR